MKSVITLRNLSYYSYNENKKKTKTIFFHAKIPQKYVYIKIRTLEFYIYDFLQFLNSNKKDIL